MGKKYMRSTGYRPRRRHFHGKKAGDQSRPAAHNLVEMKSASAKKLKLCSSSSPARENSNSRETLSGNRIINISLFFEELQKFVCCRVCHSAVEIKETSAYGLASVFEVSCAACEESARIRNCLMIGSKRNIPEINRRVIYAMRSIGRGLADLSTFCGLMDLPTPVTQKSYDRIVKVILAASRKVSEESMIAAAAEEISSSDSKSIDITVSGDGSWKTRGHTSKIGVCTVIGDETGKVLDAEVLSNFCKTCSSGTSKKPHECSKNHSGSSGSMEAAGMLKIFQRSLETRNVRYTKYIGDGDSKTFNELSNAYPYGADVALEKVECVGHVQKRMGTKLRKLKAEMRGKKLSDGKTLAGKGRLTDKMIDRLTVYYGNAIRSHSSSLENMRKAVWAVYCHTRSNDEEPLHFFCPKGPDSWCKYQKEMACAGNSKDVVYHHKNTVPPAVMDCVKKVFVALSDPVLLKKCLGGKTQNANEAFNSTIWKYCPKVSSSGRRIAEIAVSEATIVFNEGNVGRLKTMIQMGVMPMKFSIAAAQNADLIRVRKAEFRKEEETLEARRAKRRREKEQNERLVVQEGPSYGPGEF